MYDLMKHESKRLQTFQMEPPWPKDYVDIKKLAKAGFFYAFTEDKVHCAFCRGQVCQWDRDDDPMSEHARHFSTCPFIMGGDVGNIPLGEDPFPGPKRPRPYDVCGIFQQTNVPNEEPRHYSSMEPQFHMPMFDVSNDHSESQEIISHPIMNNNLTTSILPASNQPTSNICFEGDTSQINSDNMFNSMCKICYTNHIQVCFVPCGHTITCLSCSETSRNCPYCRATIAYRQRAYII